MCPPECRNVTVNAIAYVDVSGRAHRPSPTVNTLLANNHFFAFKSRPFSDGFIKNIHATSAINPRNAKLASAGHYTSFRKIFIRPSTRSLYVL